LMFEGVPPLPYPRGFGAPKTPLLIRVDRDLSAAVGQLLEGFAVQRAF
jgi:hypothetical protein